jgi:hypothetical protein
MYAEFEQMIIAKVTSAAPPLYHEQRDQYVRTLPWLALINVGLAVLLGGWIGGTISLVGLLINAPQMVGGILLSTFFWFVFLPPLFWATAFMPLRDRRLIGWRLFVVGTLLSLIGALLTLSVFGIFASGAILYFTILCYDEFYRR